MGNFSVSHYSRIQMSAGGAEILLQGAAAGFSGAVAQAFHRVRPAWQGCGVAAALVLCIQHPLELVVHRMRGTPHWRGGVLVSMGFSVAAAAVNMGLMRRGFLIVGGNARDGTYAK